MRKTGLSKIKFLEEDSRVKIFSWRHEYVGFGLCKRQCFVLSDLDWLHNGM
jgi:hypothetical protein